MKLRHLTLLAVVVATTLLSTLSFAQSTTADVVYGQLGSFTTRTVDKGGVSANSLAAPETATLDSSGNLYVGDSENSRVLFYPAGSTTATRV